MRAAEAFKNRPGRYLDVNIDKDNFGWNHVTASNYMNAAKAFGKYSPGENLDVNIDAKAWGVCASLVYEPRQPVQKQLQEIGEQ